MPRPLIGINCDTAPKPSGEQRFALERCYFQAVEDAGGLPVLLPWQSPASIKALLPRLDGILFTGGADLDPGLYGEAPHPAMKPLEPERQASDLALARAVLARRLPVLAICLGCQLLNVSRKGGLVQDIPSQVPNAMGHTKTPEIPVPKHRVRVLQGSILSKILRCKSLETNSFHHQSVNKVGSGLRACAWAPDGVVEAVEDPRHPFLVAVQWHPERIYRERSIHARLFRALVLASCGRMARASGEGRSRPALKNGARRVDKGMSQTTLT